MMVGVRMTEQQANDFNKEFTGMFGGLKADKVWVDEMVPELSGFEQRQARYRESNSKKKARDLERRKQRQRKRNGFMR